MSLLWQWEKSLPEVIASCGEGVQGNSISCINCSKGPNVNCPEVSTSLIFTLSTSWLGLCCRLRLSNVLYVLISQEIIGPMHCNSQCSVTGLGSLLTAFMWKKWRATGAYYIPLSMIVLTCVPCGSCLRNTACVLRALIWRGSLSLQRWC